MTKEHLHEMHRENVLLLLLLLFSGGRFLWWVALQMCSPLTSPIPLTPYLVVVHVEERETSIFLGRHMLGVLGTTLLCRSFFGPFVIKVPACGVFG